MRKPDPVVVQVASLGDVRHVEMPAHQELQGIPVLGKDDHFLLLDLRLAHNLAQALKLGLLPLLIYLTR